MMTSLPLAQVHPNPHQPRKHFDQAGLEELAAAIKQNGLLQPITVRLMAPDPRCAFGGDQHGNLAQYQIVTGERRWRAHQLAGLATIGANIVEMNDDALAISAIVENLQRQDITPLEEARAFRRMIDVGYTPDALAERLGLKQPWRVKDRVQLLTIQPDLLDLFEKGHLTPSQAFELSRLAPAGQHALFALLRDGRCDTYAKLRSAADGILAASAQAAMFELPPPPTKDELATLSKFERMIERLIRVCSEGIRDNEVVVLRKIDPNRAATVVEQLGLIRNDLARMERALQHAAVQGVL